MGYTDHGSGKLGLATPRRDLDHAPGPPHAHVGVAQGLRQGLELVVPQPVVNIRLRSQLLQEAAIVELHLTQQARHEGHESRVEVQVPVEGANLAIPDTIALGVALLVEGRKTVARCVDGRRRSHRPLLLRRDAGQLGTGVVKRDECSHTPLIVTPTGDL